MILFFNIYIYIHIFVHGFFFKEYMDLKKLMRHQTNESSYTSES